MLEVVTIFVKFPKLATLGAAPAMLDFAKPLAFGLSVKDEPLLGAPFALKEPVNFVAVDSPAEPTWLLFESAVSFETGAEVDSPKTPRMASAIEPSIEVPFDTRMLLAMVLFRACLLFAPTLNVESSTEIAFGSEILGYDDAKFKG